MKFKLDNKGKTSQLFGGNPSIYKKRGTTGHSGEDTVKGWNAVVEADNDCLVYKVILSHQSSENWQGVYMLVHIADDKYVEVPQGHFNEVLVKEGQWIPEFCPIGREGNKGYVFSGGVQITPAMQRAGDTRGAHTHNSTRPVMRVPAVTKGEYYLETRAGVPFKDSEGYVYQIIHKDNGYKGMVDPRIYAHRDTAMQQLTGRIRYYRWLIAQRQKKS